MILSPSVYLSIFLSVYLHLRLNLHGGHQTGFSIQVQKGVSWIKRWTVKWKGGVSIWIKEKSTSDIYSEACTTWYTSLTHSAVIYSLHVLEFIPKYWKGTLINFGGKTRLYFCLLIFEARSFFIFSSVLECCILLLRPKGALKCDTWTKWFIILLQVEFPSMEVELMDRNLWVAMATIIFNPLFWNIVSLSNCGHCGEKF